MVGGDDNSKEFLDIVSCCDENYIRHLGVLMTSIKVNNKIPIRYWILHNGVSGKSQDKIMSLESPDFSISFIGLDGDELLPLKDSLYNAEYISVMSYARLFLGRYVPDYVSRLVYLDCDMICRAGLDELREMDFDGNIILGVRDAWFVGETNHLKTERYINAGFLLIDLDGWRNTGCGDAFLDYLRDGMGDPRKLYCHDQDVINAVLHDRIGYMDNKWNVQTSSSPICREQNKLGRDAVILHYVTDQKPWIKGSRTPFLDEYRRYHAMSPWKEESIEVLSVRKDARLRDRMRSKLEKVAIYRYIHDDTGFVYRGASSIAWVMGSVSVRDVEFRRMMESRNVEFRQLCIMKMKASFGSSEDAELVQYLIDEEICRNKAKKP